MGKHLFDIDEGVTYVRLHNFDASGRDLIKKFEYKYLSKWEKVPGDTYGSYKYQISHRFGIFTPDEKEYRMAKPFLTEFKEFLKLLQINIDGISNTILPIIPPAKAKFDWLDKEMTPRNEEQVEYCDFILREDKNLVVINASTGRGKSCRNDTPVQTPTGWKPIGSLHVGDEVIAWDGTVTVVTGVFPQGVISVNKIVFRDRREAVVSDDHLWTVYVENEQCVMTTKTIKKALDTTTLPLAIPLIKPYDPSPINFPIPPYLLGVFVGDNGNYGSGKYRATLRHKPVVTKVSEALLPLGLTLVKPHLGRSGQYRLCPSNKSSLPMETITKTLKELELYIAQRNNTLPDECLLGSIEQREALLQGLLDPDANIDAYMVITYITAFESLALMVQKLARSLGGLARLTNRKVEEGHSGKRFQVALRMPYPERIITRPKFFSLGKENLFHSANRLGIRSIEYDGEEACTCISVAHPDKLFVIDDYIATHNTIMTVIGFVKMGYRVVITNLPRYVSVWIITFKERLQLAAEDIINVSEWDINELYDAFKNNTINPKIVFFQLTRIDGYLKRMVEYPNDIPSLDAFYEAMRPGVRIVDEAHESIHSVYSSLMYGNIEKTIALSATLRGDDEFINKMYNGIFPYSAYIRPPTYDKYMEVITYYHRMNVNKYRIRTEGFGGYQHTLYENSILKNKHVFERYYQMAKEAFQLQYMEPRREGQKALFFFATIAMCNRFAERLMKDYPKEDIFVFTGEISKKKGMANSYREHDIVVTTPGSCSTAKDIPKLFIVFSGVSVSSSQRIDQMTGRLRDISQWWPDLSPIYLTFVCRDIQKQVQYDWKKKQVVKKKTKRFVQLDSGFYI